jgi:putative ATP-dependent endonuclease of the OLD family
VTIESIVRPDRYVRSCRKGEELVTLIRSIDISNFRSIRKLTWLPSVGINCLVGPGDSGKSSILDAIDLCLGARRFATFTDTDFHGLDVSQPIQISITLGQLDEPLKNIDTYGDYLLGFNVATGKIEPEPGTGLEPALNLQLTVHADLEPEWTLVSPRAQAMGRTRNLAWADRVRIAPGRLGATGDSHLSWRRGSVVSKLTDGTADAQAELMRAARELRQGFDTTKLKELDGPLKLILAEAQGLGLPVGSVIRAMLDAGSITFNAGTISLHDEIGIPLRSLGVGSSRLLIVALQRKVSTSTTTFVIDELEYGLEPHRIIRLLATLGAKDQAPPVQVFATSHSPVVTAELNAAQLFVVRCGTAGHIVLQASQGGDVQGAIRSNPHALLAAKIIVCEGASEIGIVRGLDQRFSSDGHPALATHGATVVNGNGDDTFRRAIAFQALGYTVAILRDSDKPAPAILEAAFLKDSGQVFAWTAGRALEQELFAAVPDQAAKALLDLAIEQKDKDAVQAHVENVSAKAASLAAIEAEFAAGTLGAASRTVLGNAAARHGWLKTQTSMEVVGHVIVGPVHAQCQSSLTDVINGLWLWAKS